MGCIGSDGCRETDYDDFASGLNKMAVKRSGCPHWRVLFLNGKSKYPYPGVICNVLKCVAFCTCVTTPVEGYSLTRKLGSFVVKRPITEQVGVEIANKTSSKLGYLIVSRPYDADTHTTIFHRGPVSTFLDSSANQKGVWLIEIDTPNSVEMHLVRWKEEISEWEYLGETKGGVL